MGKQEVKERNLKVRAGTRSRERCRSRARETAGCTGGKTSEVK